MNESVAPSFANTPFAIAMGIPWSSSGEERTLKFISWKLNSNVSKAYTIAH